MSLCEVNMSDGGGLFSGVADAERAQWSLLPEVAALCNELVHAK